MPVFPPPPVVVEREVVQVVKVIQEPVPTPTPALSAGDQAAIYAVAVRQLYTVDYTFDEPPDSPVVYLQPKTQDGMVHPMAPYAESRLLPE